MRSRELQQVLATMMGRTIGEIDQRTRVLREAAEIRTGPRGFSAPEMTPAEAALHLLCLVARRASDSGAVQRRLTVECCYRPDGQHDDLIEAGGSMPLATMITYALTHPLNWLGRIEIDDAGRWAFVRVARANGAAGSLFFACDETVDREYIDEMAIGGRFVIGPALLMGLRKALVIDPAGEVEPMDARAALEAMAAVG